MSSDGAVWGSTREGPAPPPRSARGGAATTRGDAKVGAGGAKQSVEVLRAPAVVALRELLGAVADPVLGKAAPTGEVRLAERLVAEARGSAHITPVEIPDARRLPVDDGDAGAVVLVEHGEHRPQPGRGVHERPFTDLARQRDRLD